MHHRRAYSRSVGALRLLSSCIVAAIIVASATSLPALAQDAARPVTSQQAAEYGKLLDAVSETITRHFVDGEKLKAIDWPAQVEALRPRLLAAPTRTEARRLINELLAKLKTSHTNLFGPDEVSYYTVMDAVREGRDVPRLIAERFWGNAPYYASIGIFSSTLDGRHFIDGVLEGSPAAQAGLQYGDEIVSVDGAPYHPIASFEGKIGRDAAVAVRRSADGEPTVVHVRPAAMVPSVAFASAAYASARVIEHAGKRIGYFHVWGSRDASAFKTTLSRLVLTDLPGEHSSMLRSPDERVTNRPVDGLIIDMRGKVGGSATVYREYLAALGERFGPAAQFRFFKPGRSRDQDTVAQPFRGRTVLLIDHTTRSTAELFAYAFRRQGMGPLVGTTTAGAVSAASTFAMPGGDLLYAATFSITADGDVLEGKGVAPDIVVERPLAYAQGADPVLERALAEIVNLLAVKGDKKVE
jgi:carboxyl-terminal processing protease